MSRRRLSLRRVARRGAAIVVVVALGLLVVVDEVAHEERAGAQSAPDITEGPTAAGKPKTAPIQSERLAAVWDFANGDARFDVPPAELRPRTSRAKALRAASRNLPAGARRVIPQVRFALYSASSPATRDTSGVRVARFSRRPVWVVRYGGVVGRRASPIVVLRPSPPGPTSSGQTSSGQTSTTVADLRVVTDVLIVIDDRSGEEIMRTEMAAGAMAALR